MSNIDLQPVEDQIKKINSAAYRVLYNLLSKTYNIEKQYSIHLSMWPMFLCGLIFFFSKWTQY